MIELSDSIPSRDTSVTHPIPVHVGGVKMYAYDINDINSINKHLFQLETLLLSNNECMLNLSNCERVKDQAILIANKATIRIGQVEKGLSSCKIQELKNEKEIRRLQQDLSEMSKSQNAKWKWGGIGAGAGFLLGVILAR